MNCPSCSAKMEEETFGVIVVFRLLPQKEGSHEEVDHEEALREGLADVMQEIRDGDIRTKPRG